MSAITRQVVPRPLVVAGPSGVGKGTLLERLRNTFPKAFGFSVSYTSRQPRPGEQSGVQYHFVSREDFLNRVAAKAFLEYADNFGNLYGTSIGEVEKIQKTGKICLLEVDIQGVQQIKESSMGSFTNYIFITPPSLAELERRLRGRGTETESRMEHRLAVAVKEIDSSKDEGLFDRIIINDDFDRASEELRICVEKLYPGIKDDEIIKEKEGEDKHERVGS